MAIKRRFTLAAVVLLLSLAACRGKHSLTNAGNQVRNEEEATPRLASIVRMNDPAAKAQLLTGFFALENNSWRWTGQKFSVLLRTPPGAAQGGAELTLALNVPDAVIQNLGKITLSASAGGTLLKTTSYNAPGLYTFSADVPPALLAGETLKADFALDKSLPPAVDKRQLGIIVVSAGLAIK